jgi:hypothetical protein
MDLQVKISALEWDVNVGVQIEQKPGPAPDSSAEDSKLACPALQRSAVQGVCIA